ncbi:MAG: hypothetical protein NTW86_24535, partial [Candidatus Sumerlaeota bacterium]|nr:hypothetical protein [Candidatus Sumerlaeota bacterium]
MKKEEKTSPDGLGLPGKPVPRQCFAIPPELRFSFRIPHSAFRIPQFRTPHSELCTPHSALRIPLRPRV